MMETNLTKGEAALLKWCQRHTHYPGVNVVDFTTSWKDGMAFLALLHSFRPSAVDLSAFGPENPTKNLTAAFEIARTFGIHKIFEVDDMRDVDHTSMIMYLSQFYQIFSSRLSRTVFPIGDRTKQHPQHQTTTQTPTPVIQTPSPAVSSTQFTNNTNPPNNNMDSVYESIPSFDPVLQQQMLNKLRSSPPTANGTTPKSSNTHNNFTSKTETNNNYRNTGPAAYGLMPSPTPSASDTDTSRSSQYGMIPSIHPRNANSVNITSTLIHWDYFDAPRNSTGDAPLLQNTNSIPRTQTEVPPVNSHYHPLPKSRPQTALPAPPLKVNATVPNPVKESSSSIEQLQLKLEQLKANESKRVSSEYRMMKGWMEKKGDVGMIKGWKRRYFTLSEDKILYSKEKTDSEYIGFIPLKEATSIEISKGKIGHFQINTPSRVWYLRTSTVEMDYWIKAIQTQMLTIQGKKDDHDELKQKEGTIEVVKNYKSAKLMYFILRNSLLLMCKSKEDKRPVKIPMYQCEVQTVNGSLVDIKCTTKKKVLILRCMSEDERKSWMIAMLEHKLAIEKLIETIEP